MLKNRKTKAQPRVTKVAAMKHARENVSFGSDGRYYKIIKYDDTIDMWREGYTRNYHEGKAFYAQALLDTAAEYLDKPKIQYNGGNWTRYMRKF